MTAALVALGTILVLGFAAIAVIVAVQMLGVRHKAVLNAEQALRTRWGSTYDGLVGRFGRRRARQTVHEHEIRDQVSLDQDSSRPDPDTGIESDEEESAR